MSWFFTATEATRVNEYGQNICQCQTGAHGEGRTKSLYPLTEQRS